MPQQHTQNQPTFTRDCPRWYTALQEIKSLHTQYQQAYTDCLQAKDFTPLKPLKSNLQQKLQDLQKTLNPYETILRRQLASKLNAIYITDFNDGIALMLTRDNKGQDKVHYINKAGQKLLSGKYTDGVDKCARFKEGIGIIQYKGKQHYVNQNGRFLLKDEFEGGADKCRPFSEGVGMVKKEEKWFWIDREGHKLLKGKLADGVSDILNFKNGIGRVQYQGKWFYVNKNGEIQHSKTCPEGFNWCGEFQEGTAVITIAKKHHIIDESYRPIDAMGMSPGTFDRAIPFQNGYARVQIGGKWFYLDKTGRSIMKDDFADGVDYCSEFSEEVALVLVNEKYYFIDSHCRRTILKGKFANGVDDASVFCQGVATVKMSDKEYLINKKGDIVLKGIFKDGVETIESSKNKFLNTYFNGRWFYLDRKGNSLLRGKFENGVDSMFDFRFGSGVVKFGDKYFCVDKKGNNILKGEFASGVDVAFESYDGIIQLQHKGKFHYVDSHGRKIFTVLDKNPPRIPQFIIFE